MPIKELLTGKTAKERAEIKSKEIAKLNPVGIYENAEYGVKVEIQSLKEIEGGIEIVARAWKGTSQLGFGVDGSVEWERFKIYNPPILTDDPNGAIVLNWTDEITKQTKQRKLREDPITAIQNSLAHIVNITGKEGTNIKKGKYGSTVSTFYTDGASYEDGTVGRTAQNETWANIRAGAGTATANVDASSGAIFYILCSATTNQYDSNYRGSFVFPTATLPDTDTIDSAVI